MASNWLRQYMVNNSDLQDVEAVLMGSKRPRSNLDLWQQIHSLINEHQHEVVVMWVKGHYVNRRNIEVDELATSAVSKYLKHNQGNPRVDIEVIEPMTTP